jgi:hypothetical protein
VGHDQGVDAAHDTAQGLGVGNEGVDTTGVVVRETDAGVDQDPAPVMAGYGTGSSPRVATAALSSIRDDLKAQRLKTREAVAKAKAKAPAKKKAAATRVVKAVTAVKPSSTAPRKQAAAKKAPARKAAPAKTAKRTSPRKVVSPAPAPAPEAATE